MSIVIAVAILLAAGYVVREWRHVEQARADLSLQRSKEADERATTLVAIIGASLDTHSAALAEAAASYQLMSSLASELADRQHRIECEQFDLAVRIQNGQGHKSVRMP